MAFIFEKAGRTSHRNEKLSIGSREPEVAPDYMSLGTFRHLEPRGGLAKDRRDGPSFLRKINLVMVLSCLEPPTSFPLLLG